MAKLSFIIPCYGSEKTISQVIKEIKQTVVRRREYEYEIILVNDSSPDNVYDVIIKLCKKDKRIKAVNLTKNYGQQAALMAGQAQVTGDIVICLDDDGQSPVNELFKLINKLQTGYDVVFADFGMKKQSIFKNFGSWINLKMLQALLNSPKGLAYSSYFAMRRNISDAMIKYTNPYPYNVGLILSVTRNIATVPCEDRKRLFGRTGYTFTKLIALWVNGLTNFSIKPLHIATFLGLLCGGFGFGFGLYTVISKIFNPNLPIGYSSIIAMISFVGGAILFVLGIIGEYVGRIFISINKIPQYVVKEKINIK